MYTKLSSTLTSFQGSGKQTYYKYPNMILIISSDEVAVNLVPLYMVGPRNLYIHILLGSTSLQPRIKNKNYIFFYHHKRYNTSAKKKKKSAQRSTCLNRDCIDLSFVLHKQALRRIQE